MGPMHQSLNVMKLAAGAEKISGMPVPMGEAPGRNFRGTGTQRGGGSEYLSTTKIQGAQGGGEEVQELSTRDCVK